MSEYLKELLSKKNLINILILAILVLAIPLTINLVRQQQILSSKAATNSVQLVDNTCTTLVNGKKVLTCPTVTLRFVAPAETEVLSAQKLVKTAYAQQVTCAQGNCGVCAKIQPCPGQGLETYDRCEDDRNSILGSANFCKNGATRFRCNSSQTTSCTSNPNLSGSTLESRYAYSCAGCFGTSATATSTPASTAAPTSAPTTAPTSAPTGTTSTCPTRALQDIGNEELIAKCTLAEIALLPNGRLETFDLGIIALLPNKRLMDMSLEFLAKLPDKRLQDFDLEFLGKFPNDRLKTFSIDFLQKFSNDRLITFPLDILAQFPEARIKTFPCEIQVQLGYSCGSTLTGASNIVKVRYAENSSDLTNPNLRHEIAYIPGGVLQQITFSTSTPGAKFIYAQFIDDKGQTQNGNPFPFQIDLVGPTPLVSGFACEVDIVNSSDLLFKLIGTNFGSSKGTVTLKDGPSLSIDGNWTDSVVTARLSSPPKSATTLGTQYFATLTTSSGQKSPEQQCGVGITQISLGGKLFCRAPRNFDQNNVDLVIVSENDRTQKSTEKVVIDKDGNITNMKVKLKEGEIYTACIKAPLSLRRCSAPFTASAGTNILAIDLPIGDLNGDGSINNFDGTILKGQWGVINSSKNCDVNRDGACNAFEWSCMLHDFQATDKAIP